MKKTLMLFLWMLSSVLKSQIDTDYDPVNSVLIDLNSDKIWMLNESGLLSFQELKSIKDYIKEYGEINSFKELSRIGFSSLEIEELKEYVYVENKQLNIHSSFIRKKEEVKAIFQVVNKEVKFSSRTFFSEQKRTNKNYLKVDLKGGRIMYGNIYNPLIIPFYYQDRLDAKNPFIANLSHSKINRKYLLVGSQWRSWVFTVGQEVKSDESLFKKSKFALVNYTLNNFKSEIRIRNNAHQLSSVFRSLYSYSRWGIGLMIKSESKQILSREIKLNYILNSNHHLTFLWRNNQEYLTTKYQLNYHSKIKRWEVNFQLNVNDRIGDEKVSGKMDIRNRSDQSKSMIRLNLKSKRSDMLVTHDLYLSSRLIISNQFYIQQEFRNVLTVIGGSVICPIHPFLLKMGVYQSIGSTEQYFSQSIFSENGRREQVNLHGKDGLSQVSILYRWKEVDFHLVYTKNRKNVTPTMTSNLSWRISYSFGND
jgi:hypothetical protein